MRLGWLLAVSLSTALATASAVFLVGCSDAPRIDASSEQSLLESSEQIAAQLPPEKAQQFNLAMAQIHSLAAVELLAGEKTMQQIQQETQQKLDNRTAAEVIALAQSMEADFQEQIEAQMELFMPQKTPAED